MSQSLKTSHPSHEYQVYRGVGGSISKFGMGDTDRVSASMRGLLESKLSNRSLILVGGGVHKVGSTAKVDDSMGNNGSGSLVSGSHNTTSSSGKRVRKRVGGNGIFGSISNKKRKKLLNKISLDKQQKQQQQQQHSKGKTVYSNDLQIHDGDEKPNPLLINEEQSKSGIKLEMRKTAKSNTINTAQVHEKVGSVVETLHKMWLSYIKQLLSTIKHTVRPDSSQLESSQLSVHDCKQISFLLATAEHVGMSAAIVECPSRRHLVHCRCVIVNETKETYGIAMIKSKSNKKQDNKSDEKQASEVGTKADSDNKKKDGNDKSSVNSKSSHNWKIVLVPKHGTVLDIDLPRIDDNTVSASNNDGDDEASRQKRRSDEFTVRLQT